MYEQGKHTRLHVFIAHLAASAYTFLNAMGASLAFPENRPTTTAEHPFLEWL